MLCTLLSSAERFDAFDFFDELNKYATVEHHETFSDGEVKQEQEEESCREGTGTDSTASSQTFPLSHYFVPFQTAVAFFLMSSHALLRVSWGETFSIPWNSCVNAIPSSPEWLKVLLGTLVQVVEPRYSFIFREGGVSLIFQLLKRMRDTNSLFSTLVLAVSLTSLIAVAAASVSQILFIAVERVLHSFSAQGYGGKEGPPVLNDDHLSPPWRRSMPPSSSDDDTNSSSNNSNDGSDDFLPAEIFLTQVGECTEWCFVRFRQGLLWVTNKVISLPSDKRGDPFSTRVAIQGTNAAAAAFTIP